MSESVSDKGARYTGYSELRLGQQDPDLQGSAERWNTSRVRRAGRAIAGIFSSRIEAQMDADHTEALKKRIAEGPAHTAAQEASASGAPAEALQDEWNRFANSGNPALGTISTRERLSGGIPEQPTQAPAQVGVQTEAQAAGQMADQARHQIDALRQ